MVASTCEQGAFLCQPPAQLLTLKPSRRPLPAVAVRQRRPPPAAAAAPAMAPRRRRGLHALLGVALGLAAGLLAAGLRGCPRAGPAAPGWPPPPPQQPQQPDPLAVVGLRDPRESVSNSRRTLLFAGVMTAQRYVATRAVAVFDTWGRELPGRVAFFSSWASERPPGRPDLPLVRLRGVDDSYPPQKKSFLMLQYMWEHFGDRFEWFLRADDDVYVRPDRLARLLRSVDSRKAQFIGQAGRGNQEEFGLLSLEYDENFCMGGPGVILSRETLARVAPHIKQCLRNLYTTHEDVELGRCVQKYAGIPCTWSYEMQTILYHNSSGAAAFTGSLKQKEVHRAITLHPVKQHGHMYRVHAYMQGLRARELQSRGLLLHRDAAAALRALGRRPEDAAELRLGRGLPLFPARRGHPAFLGDPARLGLPPGLRKFRPRSEAQVLAWDFISRSLYSDGNLNPRRRPESALREGLDDVVREVMDMINMYSKQRGRVIEYRELLYGYRRLDPAHGADYVLDLLLLYKKYRGRKMTVPVRRHVYLQQPFTGLEVRELPPPGQEQEQEQGQGQEQELAGALQSGLRRLGQGLGLRPGPEPPPDPLVHLVLPLAGRLPAFRRFLATYEDVVLRRGERAALIVALVAGPDGAAAADAAEARRLLGELRARFPAAARRLRVLPLRPPFARALALEAGAALCADSDLLLFVDVDMHLTAGALRRARAHTRPGRQAYFPIVFSEYDPAVVRGPPDHLLISRDAGYWRQYGFGIAAMYKRDLRAVGGLDTSIRGWGREDVQLFERAVAANGSGLRVFRAPDPGLVHVFHPVQCDPALGEAQLRMCRATSADSLGGAVQLGELLLRHPQALRRRAQTAAPQPPS